MTDRNWGDQERRWRRDEDDDRYDRDYQGPSGRRRGSVRAYDRDMGRDWDDDMANRNRAESWMVPGPHTGRGPRGWQRSDARIQEDVCERLSHHGRIDASDITVEVNEGEVTLTGSVADRRSKRMAEDIAESVSGVKDIHNRLRVDTAAWQQGSVRQGDSIGWAQGQAQHQERDSLGWPQGQAQHRESDSIGWAEGQAQHDEEDSIGWAEGQAETDRSER